MGPRDEDLDVGVHDDEAHEAYFGEPLKTPRFDDLGYPALERWTDLAGELYDDQGED
jgi:hypothetical protein